MSKFENFFGALPILKHMKSEDFKALKLLTENEKYSEDLQKLENINSKLINIINNPYLKYPNYLKEQDESFIDTFYNNKEGKEKLKKTLSDRYRSSIDTLEEYSKNLDKIDYTFEILFEAQEEVNSESQSDPSQSQNGENRKLSDEQIQQIAQGIQDGSISEEEIQSAIQQGQIGEGDVELIQQAMGQQSEESAQQKEEISKQQVDQITDSFIRLNLFDKINDLEEKFESFINTSNDAEMVEKIKQLKNYLDIILSLVYNMDVNLLYQLYATIELKAITLFKEKMGIKTIDDDDEYLINLQRQAYAQELKSKFPKEILMEKLASGELEGTTILEDLVKYQIYSEEEIQQMMQEAQQQQEQQQAQEQGQPEQGSPADQQPGTPDPAAAQAQPQPDQPAQQANPQQVDPAQAGQAQAQPQPTQGSPADQQAQAGQAQAQPQNNQEQLAQQMMQSAEELKQAAQVMLNNSEQDEITQIANAIVSGQMSADELIQQFMNNQISKEDFKKIISKIDEIKKAGGEGSSGDQAQSQAQSQGEQQITDDESKDLKAKESKEPKKKKNVDVSSDAVDV